MIYRATGKAIAQAIGVTPGRVSQLRKDGMPDSSVEAAVAWYRRRVDPARAAGQRGPPAPSAEPPERADGLAAARRVAELAPLADVALQAGRFPLIERDLRAALAAVPPELRGQVRLPVSVFRELVAPVHDLVVSAAGESPGGIEAVSDPAEAAWLAEFWYGVAAGEVAPSRA